MEPVVSGEDGRAALALALEINEAMAAHAQRAGLSFGGWRASSCARCARCRGW